MLLELWPFAVFGHLMLLYKFRIMYANVLKFYIWIPHEKIGDPYFFVAPAYSRVRYRHPLFCPSVCPSVHPHLGGKKFGHFAT